MSLPFFEAHTAPTSQPVDETNTKTTAAPDESSFDTGAGSVDFVTIDDSPALQPTEAALEKTEPLDVVKQTIDDLEAQGLLMLFDRHDQVAKRLTGDLIAAGVLPDAMQPTPQEAYSSR